MTEPQLGRLLLAAHRTLAGELVVELEERGWPDLRASQAALVLNVDRRFGTRLTELARRAGVTKQAMMVVVDELEVRGLVRRTPDPEDGRAKVVRLTARGRTFAAECRQSRRGGRGPDQEDPGRASLRGAARDARPSPRDGGGRRGPVTAAVRQAGGGTGGRRGSVRAGPRAHSPVARSASTSPISGVNLKPWPLQGDAITSEPDAIDHEVLVRGDRVEARLRPQPPGDGNEPAADPVDDPRLALLVGFERPRIRVDHRSGEVGAGLDLAGLERVGHDVGGLGRRLVPVDHGREIAARPRRGTWTAPGSVAGRAESPPLRGGDPPTHRLRRSPPERGSSRRRRRSPPRRRLPA